MDSTGRPGPDLILVSSSEPALAAVVSPAQEQPAPVASAVVSGELTTMGAWAAYIVLYPGDFSEARFIVVYTPADPFTDEAVSLNVYSPNDPPPGGTRVASATPGYRSGVKVTSLFSDVRGAFLVIVTNWDVINRPLQYTVLTSDVEGNPGPPLTFISPGS